MHDSPTTNATTARTAGSTAEVFAASLKLGLTSFGGPIAHLGYFEQTYVQARRWLSEEEYGGLVGLCQLLPGPTSSQVGFLIGHRRIGWLGALAAWVGFTLPSALLMYAFAVLAPQARGPLLQAVLHGLMLAAVAVVAQAVWSMARNLCPDRERTAIALLAAVLLLFHGSGAMQFTAMLLGATGGWILCRKMRFPTVVLPIEARARRVDSRMASVALLVFCALLLILPVLAALAPHGPIALASIFYRAGALVFGGGHVVLPLLREALVPGGWVSDDAFLAGYGLAQGMPGPLFTVAAYLGAVSAPAHASALWAITALVAIFLPGLLLAIAGLSLWSRLAHVNGAQAILAGVNASVVGILGAALYNPVWVSGVRTGADAAVAITGSVLLARWRAPPIAIVVMCALASAAIAMFRWNQLAF
jgi:chromate transporter